MLSSVSEMWSWWVLVTAISVLWFLWLSKRSRNQNPPLPPGPRGLPVLGYIPFLGTHIHRQFTDLAKVYGPIFKLRLGTKLCVVISSPSLMKQVLRDHDSIFANRTPTIAGSIITYGNTNVAFPSYGPYFRKVRKSFVSQMLSNSNLDSCYHLRRQEVQNSIKNVYEKIGTPVYVGKLAFVTAVSAVLKMVVGGAEGVGQRSNLAGDFRDVVSELMVVLGKPNVSDMFPVLARFDIQGIARAARKIAKRCEQLLDSIIEQRMSSGQGFGDESEGKRCLEEGLLAVLVGDQR